MGFEIAGEAIAEEVFADAAIDTATGEAIAAGYESAAAEGMAAGAAGEGLGAAIARIGANFALSALTAKLLGPRIGSRTETAQGAQVNSLSTTDPIAIIYGTRRVGATVCPLGVSGLSREFLHVLCVWSEGPISAINTVYLDGVASTDPKFAGLVTREDYLGTDSQAASSTLIAAFGDPSKWNASCTLAGIAYTYLILKWDQTAFAKGRPLITADIDGRLLFDPRSSTTAFSRNPWLAIRDYLSNARYGRGYVSTVLDDATFQTEANHADEAVSLPVGGTQARYTCDGVLNPDDAPLDNVRSLLSSCRGSLIYSGGKYKAVSDRTGSAVSLVLNEDNIVGAWSWLQASTRTRYNGVKARFYNAASLYQPDITVWPPAGSAQSATFIAQDAGRLLQTSLELPLTTDLYRAQQIAQIECKKSRNPLLVSLTATVAAMALEIGDIVPVAHSTPGWPAGGDPANGKLFRVEELELLATDEVRLGLRLYDASAYTLDALNTAPSPVLTSLPDPSTAAAPGAPVVLESQYQTADSAGVKNRATVSWTAPSDVFVQNGGWYQLERSPAGASSWTVYPRVQSSGLGTVSFVVDDIAAASYDWRVAAFNVTGAKSPYSPVTTKEIAGLNSPPSNIANFAVQSYSGLAKFTWSKLSPVTDLAVLVAGRVFVRWSPKTSGASWDQGSLVNPDGYAGDQASPAIGPLLTGTYLAKAWNGKNYSVTEASFVVTEALITGLSTIATVTEQPSFSGAKSNVAAVDGGIQLDGTTLIDSMLTNIDTWAAIDSLGGIKASGSYAFASKLDLGSVQAARLYATIDSVAYATDDMIDSRTDPIDSWGLVDGVVIEDAEVQLWVRATNDDPNGGSPNWGPFHPLGLAADYSARGFDFRLDFASGNATHNRAVTTLSVAAKH